MLILYLAHYLVVHTVQNHTSVRVDAAKASSFVPIFFSSAEKKNKAIRGQSINRRLLVHVSPAAES